MRMNKSRTIIINQIMFLFLKNILTQERLNLYNEELIQNIYTRKFAKNNNLMNAFISLLILLPISITCIFIPVTRQPYCIVIEQQSGKQVTFFYEAATTPVSQLQVSFQPGSSSNSPFISYDQKRQYKYQDTQMTVCFSTKDGSYLSVSFDYYTNDVSHIAQLAKKSDLYELYTKIISVGSRIREVNKNQLFEKEKQAIHTKLLQQNQSTLKLLVAGKLVVIVSVALAQLFILKKVLSKSGHGYQPV